MDKHPNKVRFEGTLLFVDEVSVKSPSGCNGHAVLLPKNVAKNILSSLRGMPVNCTPKLDGHNESNSVGVITSASLRGKSIKVKGHIWGQIRKSEIQAIRACQEPLGMSFEAKNAKVSDMRAAVWEVHPPSFSGAAIVRKDKAAFSNTSFRIIEDSI